MRLFTLARDRAHERDAYLIDSGRKARSLQVEVLTPLETVVETLLDRVSLIGKSVYAVRNRMFALYIGERNGSFRAAVTEPFHNGVMGALRDTLGAFGKLLADHEDLDPGEHGLAPLLAYERGKVSFLDTAETHQWLPLAGRRGMRILSATLSRAPDPDVYVGDLAAADYLAAPEEISLDLDAMSEMSDADLDRLLNEQLKDWEKR
ncbi:MAG: hypothetical protein ACYSX0_11155 [Planctomycetota bacterium]